MRRLILLSLVALTAFPLSAHGHWRDRRGMVIEDSCRDNAYRRWDDDRWERSDYGRYRRHDREDDDGRYRDHGWYRRHDRDEDCGEDRVVLRRLPRPFSPPFSGYVELWIH